MASCKFLPFSSSFTKKYFYPRSFDCGYIRFCVIPHPYSVEVVALTPFGHHFLNKRFTAPMLFFDDTFFDEIRHHRRRYDACEYPVDVYSSLCFNSLCRVFIDSLSSSERERLISQCFISLL